MLTPTVSRTRLSIVHQKSVCSARSLRSGPDMEHASALSTGVHLPQYFRYPDRQILPLSPLNHHWRLLQRTSPPLGHPLQKPSSSAENPLNRSFHRRPHPPRLFHLPRRHSKRQQHHLLLHRWSRLRLDRRHAKPPPRIPRTENPIPKQNRRSKSNLHVLPHIRPDLLPRRHRRRYHLPVPQIRPCRSQSRHRQPATIQRPHSTRHES